MQRPNHNSIEEFMLWIKRRVFLLDHFKSVNGISPRSLRNKEWKKFFERGDK